ncbi:MAG: hypothetical protein U0939_15045 [Pirellulales bacterium]
MKRSWMKMAFGVLVGATLMVGVASAQGPGGGRGGFGGGGFGGGGFGGGRGGGPNNPLMLLTIEAVQKELGLSTEAVEKGRKILEEMREAGQAEMSKLREGGSNFQDLTEDQRREMMAKMTEAQRGIQAKFIPQIKELLTAEQYARLQQISWQAAGAQALSDPELAKLLELTDEQKQKLEANGRDFQTKVREAFAGGRGGPGGGGPGGEAMAKIQELNKERDAKAFEILTADQKAALEKAKGKEFDVSQLRQGRGGPGGRPGAGGRPGGAGRPGAEGRPGN